MNRQIRRLGIAVIVLYTLLFVQLNRIQVFGAQRLNEDINNTRDILRDFGKPRGAIITADGILLAQSVPTDESKRTYRREYPQSYRFAHITGHFSSVLGSAGVEQQYNDELSGQTLKQRYRSLADLFVDRDTTANVTLSVQSKVQLAAIEAMGDRRGSVVALDPRTGEILALYSDPAYDPNLLADLSTKDAEALSIKLNADPQKPLARAQLSRDLLPRVDVQGRHRRGRPRRRRRHTRIAGVRRRHLVHAAQRAPAIRDFELQRTDLRRRALRRSCASRATRPSPAWAPKTSAPSA